MTDLALRLVSALGLVGMIAIAWVFSTQRRVVPWRVIGWGLGLQLALALLLLKTAFGRAFFVAVNRAVAQFIGFTDEDAKAIHAVGPSVHPQSTPFWLECRWDYPARDEMPPVRVTWVPPSQVTIMRFESLGSIQMSWKSSLALGSRIQVSPPSTERQSLLPEDHSWSALLGLA